jgi:hypothetical protein
VDSRPQPAVDPWVVTCSVMLATFMEVLDATVGNISTPHIAGNLDSTNEDVDLRVLKNRSFRCGVFLISLLGFVLYASLVLLPLCLQTLMGYPAYHSRAWRFPRAASGAVVHTSRRTPHHQDRSPPPASGRHGARLHHEVSAVRLEFVRQVLGYLPRPESCKVSPSVSSSSR